MYLIVVTLLFLLDVYSKVYAERKLKYNPRYLFGGRVQLYYVRNFGVAFNKLNHKKNLILVTNFLLLIYLGYLLIYTGVRKEGLALILAGGLGNTLNRLVRGYVIDFLYFKIKGFPVFNFADFYIFIGMGILIFQGEVI